MQARKGDATRKRRIVDDEDNGFPSTPRRDAVPETPTSVRRLTKTNFSTPSSPSTGLPPATPGSVSKVRKLNFEPMKEPMKVFLRLRPLSNEEIARKDTNYVQILDETTIVTRAPKNAVAYRVVEGAESKFTFSKVFGPDSTQEEIFQHAALPQLETVLKGLNGLLFAYGITNAGKTFTVTGTNREPGILPRVLEILFNSIKSTKVPTTSSGFKIDGIDDIVRSDEKLVLATDSNARFSLWISYVEIHNERIFDLLDDSVQDGKREPLKLTENKDGKLGIKDLKEVLVSTIEEALAILKKGFQNRQVADTLLNHDSSRSHTIITLKLMAIPKDIYESGAFEKDPSLARISKFSIVDLAGSERNNRTKTTGKELREAGNINTSLMTLGRCIEALRWNQMHPNSNPKIIPFRDSKLTRLLQDHFVGRSKAVMIVNASPSSSDFEETMHVFKFSAIAREVSTSTKIDTGKKKDMEDTEDVTTLIEKAVLKKEAEVRAEFEEYIRQELEAQVQIKDQLESQIREEVAKEMDMRINEIEALWKSRVDQEASISEEKFEKKLQIMNRRLAEELKAEEGIVEKLKKDNETLKVECAEWKAKYDQVLKELELTKRERADLHEKLLVLERRLASTKAESESDFNYLRLEMERELEAKQQAIDKEKLENDRLAREVSNLKARLSDVAKVSSSQKQEQTAAAASWGKQKGSKVLRTYSDSSVDLDGMAPLPPGKSKRTPTKKELKKYQKYEVVDQTVKRDNSQEAILYKGDVEQSITGGVNVKFTDMEVITRMPINTTPNGSHVKDMNDISPVVSPTITTEPVKFNIFDDNFDGDPQPQSNAIMQEASDLDLDDLIDIPLEETKKEKKEKKERVKREKKEKKEREKEEKKKEKEERKKETPNGKEGFLSKIAAKVLTPKASPHLVHEEKDKENLSANVASPKKEKSKRRLFSGKSSQLAMEEEGDGEEMATKKRKSVTRAGVAISVPSAPASVRNNGATPIARRTRSAAVTRKPVQYKI